MYENISDNGLSQYERDMKYRHKHLKKDMFDLMKDRELILSLSLVEDYFKDKGIEIMIEPIECILEKIFGTIDNWEDYKNR